MLALKLVTNAWGLGVMPMQMDRQTDIGTVILRTYVVRVRKTDGTRD